MKADNKIRSTCVYQLIVSLQKAVSELLMMDVMNRTSEVSDGVDGLNSVVVGL